MGLSEIMPWGKRFLTIWQPVQTVRRRKKNKRTKTDKTRGVGGNKQHVMDGGKGGVNICNDEEADGIVEEIGTADTHSVNDITVTVLPESKKGIVLVSKDVLREMIKMLTKEDMLETLQSIFFGISFRSRIIWLKSLQI